MTWQNLPPINLNQAGVYIPIPLQNRGGKLPVEISSFEISEKGRYEIGVYNLPPDGTPGLVAASQQHLIAPYARNVIFEVPPNISHPHIGVRLTQHQNLENKNYQIILRWQLPYGSTVAIENPQPVPSSFVAAISWAEIKQSVINEILTGYSTISDVSEAISDLQADIDQMFDAEAQVRDAAIAPLATTTALNNAISSETQAREQAIAPLATTAALSQAIAAEVQAREAAIASLPTYRSIRSINGVHKWHDPGDGLSFFVSGGRCRLVVRIRLHFLDSNSTQFFWNISNRIPNNHIAYLGGPYIHNDGQTKYLSETYILENMPVDGFWAFFTESTANNYVAQFQLESYV